MAGRQPAGHALTSAGGYQVLATSWLLELQRTAGNRAVVSIAEVNRPAVVPVQRSPQADAGRGTRNVIRHRGRWGDIDSPALLRLWAKEAAAKQLWLGSTLRALQEAPESAPQLVDGVLPKLRRTLHDPATFSGSPEARRDAVAALDADWVESRVRDEVLEELTSRYTRQFSQALANTPEGSELVTAPEDFARIRRTPYLQEFWNGFDVMRKGYTAGNREVLDIRSYVPQSQSGVRPQTDPTADIWYILRRDANWIYRTSGSWQPANWHFGKVAGEVAENTRLAAELFPLMIKIGGFSLGLSSRLALIIAGEVITAVGEQGVRSARGQQMQSALEVLKSVGIGVVVGGVTNRMFGRSDAGELAQDVEVIVERAAQKGRREVARTDADVLETALREGRARQVQDSALVSQGYRVEVDVISEGQRHTWRRTTDGKWCRFSTASVCTTEMRGSVDEALRAKPKPATGAGAGAAAGGASTQPLGTRFSRELEASEELAREWARIKKLPAGAERKAAEAALEAKAARLQAHNDEYLTRMREQVADLRARAMKEPDAAHDLVDLYKAQPHWVLRQLKREEDQMVKGLAAQKVKPAAREARRDPLLASALTKKQNEAALKKVLDSEYRMPHEATVRIVDKGGRQVGKEERFVSGGIDEADVAKYGFREANALTHTEAKALATMPLKRGEKMYIIGQYNPCARCMARMQEAVDRGGGTIVYAWPGGPRGGMVFRGKWGEHIKQR